MEIHASVSSATEVRVSKLAANIIGSLLTVVCCVAAVAVVHLLPHYRAFRQSDVRLLIVATILLFPLHESLHAVGLVVFGNVPRSAIRFGVMWRALMPYCHCKVPIS